MGEFADFFSMGICLTKMPLAGGLWRSRCQGGASHHAGLFCFGLGEVLDAVGALGVLAVHLRVRSLKDLVSTLSGRHDGASVQKKGAP